MNAAPSVTPEAAMFFERGADLFGNLWARWQDEREYEDIADYAAPLQPLAAECGVTIVRMNKRPFGCIFGVGPKMFQITVTGRSYAYKRIA